jgi:wyosine [tRNA(Phe)-imidazoG37] synthetase (radical SAM superfamily)
MRLTTQTHERDAAQLTYVYPVVSRRAGGVSVGINLNPNNACNWRCAYCQVEGLTLGSGPALDLDLMERELREFLGELLHGDWMERHVPEGSRRVNDVAFSGNGEPTTSPDFATCMELVAGVLDELDPDRNLQTILISNGSQVHKPQVQAGLARLADRGGEVWFKLDGGTPVERSLLNGMEIPDQKVIDNLVQCSRLVRTRLQTMRVAVDGQGPDEEADGSWTHLVRSAQAAGARVHDVLLYGLERKVYQPEAERLSKLPAEELLARGEAITAELGLQVQVNP